MSCIRPATPGFVATLTATILLAVVSFCVPYFKSVYFLKADITQNNVSGSITFGTLGYCLEFSGTTNCSKPSVGYEVDVNSLINLPLGIELPQIAVKWLTYALVLHLVALALAAGSAVFGLLAHVREMSMTCCSTCISGFAAGIALLAFIFDIALFFIAKSRINAVGSATMGNAIWLTLAAWVLLFFSGCFYTLGRCCISSRSPRKKWDKDREASGADGGSSSRDMYAEQMRMDAVKAEAERKNRQKEVGLPAFYESQPLTARVDGDTVYTDTPYSDNGPTGPHYNPAGGYAGGGYVQQPAGSRAVDEFYNPTVAGAAATSYPPQPRRQASAHSYTTSHYTPSSYNQTTSPPVPVISPPPTNNYLAAGQQQYRDPNSGPEYGHAAGGSTYYSAHEQHPSSYSQYDQYSSQPQQPTPAAQAYNSHATSYYSAQTGPSERSYTLGGDGYGGNSVPPLPEHKSSVPAMPDHPSTAGYVPYSNPSTPAPSMPQAMPSPPQRTLSPPQQQYDDSPPGYEPGMNPPAAAWSKHS
ncbi:rim9 protein [Moniliophthora roreri MCA 2997]|uniref:Rim9 protein n=1 Tax=Moniliophthora roreri (strain MCA 2997) TaxID=1381753 RepID=V2WU48_MONRO|nr:rim9 protein [Moniliophthora roreri MCA 2997]